MGIKVIFRYYYSSAACAFLATYINKVDGLLEREKGGHEKSETLLDSTDRQYHKEEFPWSVGASNRHLCKQHPNWDRNLHSVRHICSNFAHQNIGKTVQFHSKTGILQSTSLDPLNAHSNFCNSIPHCGNS